MKVAIFQHRLLHYRVNFFDRLKTECERRGVSLSLVHGQPSRREIPKNDVGELPWANVVVNRFWEFGERDVLWQPVPDSVKDSDLYVIMQESRILSNYPILFSRLFSRKKVAYWGHGKNFQSDVPTGFRERWKSFLLTRVDWWFAYTQMTVDILKNAGFAAGRISSLENAIDTDEFKADLASWSSEEVLSAKTNLGIEKDAPVGIFCGSLYPDKKLELLISSADWIKEKLPTFSLIVIGNGPSMPFMKECAATRPWIHLLGVKKGREKALYFRAGDVILNPGLVGLHIVDAFCSGLVMVTTRTARHSPEVAYLEDGVNGLMTEDSVESYGGAVLDLLSDKERLARMKAAALADSNRYTVDNMVKRFADGIESALKV
ncbi:glycosyltransferase family 4 protein [Parazoarcus communis]|uniref:glycosyltransferase family 4 protein n=1 Tax=Parazoarcus communis TaxID=41977 RepID=UPI0014020496|nr:glycosyltransferase family 4 protein [Parazoarcus communis]NMG72260.1 glycosyltransferase [Parazoarcus communis SWub3 = DSM 12120]